METQYLKTFKVVLETGSFSRAADLLCITQSAVSQRIKSLEDHFGQQLMDRSSPVFAPTPVGQRVLEKANIILRTIQELEEELKKVGRKIHLSFCCTPTFGVLYLPKVLDLFCIANCEEVDFKFMLQQPDHAVKGLANKEFDIIIIEHFPEVTVEDAVTYVLPDDEMVFASAPALGLTRKVLTLEELLQQRIITHRECCSSRHLLLENLSRHGLSIENFKGIVICDDLYLTIQAAQQSQGVAFVSKQLIIGQIKQGKLKEHTVPDFILNRSRSIYCNRKRSYEQIFHNFIDCVHKVFNLPFSHQNPMPDSCWTKGNQKRTTQLQTVRTC